MTDKWDLIKESSEVEGAINVVKLANDMGLKVFVSQNLDKLSGLIKRNEENQYEIYVNYDHSENRQRFTIAHEIAHYVLHEDLIGDGIYEDGMYRSNLSNIIEREANFLAAEILMPQQKIMDLWNNYDSTIESISKHFHVSEQAVAIKLNVPN